MYICAVLHGCTVARLHVNHRLPVSLELSATNITNGNHAAPYRAIIGATNNRHLSALALHSTHTHIHTYKSIIYVCGMSFGISIKQTIVNSFCMPAYTYIHPAECVCVYVFVCVISCGSSVAAASAAGETIHAALFTVVAQWLKCACKEVCKSNLFYLKFPNRSGFHFQHITHQMMVSILESCQIRCPF